LFFLLRFKFFRAGSVGLLQKGSVVTEYLLLGSHQMFFGSHLLLKQLPILQKKVHDQRDSNGRYYA